MERYATAFMRAMAPKRKARKWESLVYIDLLAGPGLGIARDTGGEFAGSPLRALRSILLSTTSTSVIYTRRMLPHYAKGSPPRITLA